LALRTLGNAVALFSTRIPSQDACPHEFATEARATTHYVFPPRVTAAARILATRPTKAIAALAYIASLNETSAKEKARLLGMLLCAADLARYCEELGIEHLHAHSCADLAHLVVLCKLLGGAEYSLTLHGDLPVYGVDHEAKMKRARFVAAVTLPLKEQIVATTGLGKERVPVIWMGVDTDRFSPPPKRASEPNKLLVATVARLNPSKGHCLVLDAIDRARSRGLDVSYAIAGQGDFRGEIEARVRELGLTNHVRFLGALGENEVLSLLRQADCFVLASTGLGEAAPVSVMEAMSCALPVIVSRIGGTADMISDGADGILLEQGDVDALTDAIVRLAREPNLRASMGARARRRAVLEFDYTNMARKLHEAITRSIADT